MQRLSLQNLLAATDGCAVGFEALDSGFERIGIDSRTTDRGDLFWAVTGHTHDGHEYVAHAIQQGAAAAVVSAARADKLAAAGPIIVVKDTHAALGSLARWYRHRSDALVIGVTGSVGKTTTREMIHAALSARFTGIRSPHNYNNHFGVPLTVLAIEPQHEFAVVEMGASAVGEIELLARIAAPEVGVVTAIGPAHLAGFGSREQIIEAKGELMAALPEAGFAVLPGDDPQLLPMADRAACRVIFVGEGPENEVRATMVAVGAERLSFQVDGSRFHVRATGRHHLTAALAAVAVGREIGMTDAEIAAGLDGFTAVPGRCRLEQVGPWTLIDDTYNANPSSMRAACELLRDLDHERTKLLVAADMLEMGPQAAAFHFELGRTAARSGIDYLLAYGRHAPDVVEGARTGGLCHHRIAACDNLDCMLTVLDCWLEPGDIVLVKGSRGMRMERVVEWMRLRAEDALDLEAVGLPARACA
ncbi:MAG: UDP-N-acetylmuramoyl-tripeptide--D-alanyl-D-alanine ligase [Planctomycetes bacterium]|nr:UDP-N-acetylmuramoyl-tripeptide--D-alanyl-D-alanine ligase [Planctomycetota bacterium]